MPVCRNSFLNFRWYKNLNLPILKGFPRKGSLFYANDYYGLTRTGFLYFIK